MVSRRGSCCDLNLEVRRLLERGAGAHEKRQYDSAEVAIISRGMAKVTEVASGAMNSRFVFATRRAVGADGLNMTLVFRGLGSRLAQGTYRDVAKLKDFLDGVHQEATCRNDSAALCSQLSVPAAATA
jgi:hypothetical protein